mmetsp:Transcript_15133/g.22948  ORF Transcript_15133/g.22948 Transcript_15133/m.22948 type:complete len:148 (-) Transcript_15133:452-895(-)
MAIRMKWCWRLGTCYCTNPANASMDVQNNSMASGILHCLRITIRKIGMKKQSISRLIIVYRQDGTMCQRRQWKVWKNWLLLKRRLGNPVVNMNGVGRKTCSNGNSLQSWSLDKSFQGMEKLDHLDLMKARSCKIEIFVLDVAPLFEY